MGTRTIARPLVVAALLLAGALALLGAACGGSGGQSDSATLILATTTSVKDSGLVDDALLPAFKAAHPGIEVKAVAVGSGEAIAMGRDGEADVLLVHSPKDEETFMADGQGTLRLPVAYNYFKIVGPAADPAGIKGSKTAAEAFGRIAKAGATFVSRGDASGTNKKELGLWNAAAVTTDPTAEPSGDWYIKSGQGMGETLQIASEKQAYTLTDYATFLAMTESSTSSTVQPLDLTVVFGQADDLKNQYSVIVVNQAEHAKVNASGAELFAAFLTSPDGQKLVGEFGVADYGEQLFVPDAGILGTAQ